MKRLLAMLYPSPPGRGCPEGAGEGSVGTKNSLVPIFFPGIRPLESAFGS